MMENTRPKVSWEGMPLGSSKNCFNHSCFVSPNNSMSSQVSAPHITAHMAMAMMSIKLCSFPRSILGSSMSLKCSTIATAFFSCISYYLLNKIEAICAYARVLVYKILPLVFLVIVPDLGTGRELDILVYDRHVDLAPFPYLYAVHDYRVDYAGATVDVNVS